MRQTKTEMLSDNSSITALYDRNAYILLNYVSRYISSKEDVNDIVLDVFISAMENQVWMAWSDGEQLAWLRRISYNKVVDYYRRLSRHPLVGLEAATSLYEDDEYSPEHILLRNEDYNILHVHLSNLSELQQEIVRLRFGHGLRLKEIARRLNKSEGVIRVTLSRALNLLRRKYL